VNKYTPISQKYTRFRTSMHNDEIMELLGIKNKRLPKEGIQESIYVQGVEVWVDPFIPRTAKFTDGVVREVKTSRHRIMCRCPGCGWVGSFGRLFQHKCRPAKPECREEPLLEHSFGA